MATVSEIRVWVESTRPYDWYGKCAGLTDRVVAVFTGRPRQWYDSATDARKASGPLNANASACPPGGIHYWSYYGKAWDGSVGDWGHVAIDIYGGGTDVLSATGYAHEYWGVNAGLISVDSQSRRASMRYLGWSRTYGAAAPLIINTNQEDDMGTIDNTEENYQTFARFLQRALKFDARENGLGADWKLGPTIFELLRAADDTADVKANAVKMTDDDRAAIAKQVTDAIKSLPTGPGGSVNADAVAEKVAQTVADVLAKRLKD